jgi:hypothetical protein
MAYGQEPYGIQIGPVGAFGIKSVTVLDPGHMYVVFSLPAIVDSRLYEPSNYVITVRYGRARTIFVKSVLPKNDQITTEVTLTLKNGVIKRGQYTLTAHKIESVFGLTIDGS